jgi:signal peptidase I
MRSANLHELLGVPIEWIEPRKTKSDAMALITVTKNKLEHGILITPRGLMEVDSRNYVLSPLNSSEKKVNVVKKTSVLITKLFSIVLLLTAITSSLLITTQIVQAKVVLTESMQPVINPGDLLVSVSPRFNSPQIGEVVIYTGKKFDGTVVASFAHRVIGGDVSSGYIVKGDANDLADVQRPIISEIEGVVLFNIPKVGLLLNPQTMSLLLVLLIGIWFVAKGVRTYLK